MSRGWPTILIALLALADGALHLSLDVVLFRGRFFANDLSTQFVLNFVGYLALVALFLTRPGWLRNRGWVVNVVMIGYIGIAIVAWLARGGPNPMGLGYLSKSIEVVLIALLAFDAVRSTRPVDGALQPAQLGSSGGNAEQ